MTRIALICLGLLLLPLPALAGWTGVEIRDVGGQKQVFLKDALTHKEQVLGHLETIPAHKPFYHWAPVKDIKRWLDQGHVDQGELDFLMQGTGASGGGFYASLDPLDSTSYGPWVAVLDSPDDLVVLKTTGYFPGADWNLVNKMLAERQIDGIWQSATWFNFIRTRPIEHIRKPTVAEIAQSKLFQGQPTTILLKLDSEIGLDPAEAARLDPALGKVLSGATDEDSLLKLAPAFMQVRTDFPEYDSALSRKYMEDVANLLRSKLESEQTWQDFATRLANAPDPLGEWIQMAERLQIQPARFLPSSNLSPIDYPALQQPIPATSNEFATRLETAFEFIDTEDLLVAAARGDGAPWALYDEPGKAPLLERWSKAGAIRQALEAPDRSQDRLVQIHRILEADSDSAYRERPIVAGGDIRHGDKGYYSIDAHQKAVLENNPFVSSEIIDDPWNQGKFLARHEYPSAANFRKFKSYLTPDLVTKLEAAAAAGQLAPDSKEFAQYTRKIIEELTSRAYRVQDPLTQYLMLMSIHPFDDFNGRSLRMLYKTETGKPLYVWNFDMDMLMTPAEFQWETKAGAAALNRFKTAAANEAKDHAGFPRFYDLPELWMMGARMNPPVPDAGSYVSTLKQFYSRGDVVDRVRHKQFQEVYADLSHCDACLARQIGH